MPGHITIQTLPSTELSSTHSHIEQYHIVEVQEGDEIVQKICQDHEKDFAASPSIALLGKLF